MSATRRHGASIPAGLTEALQEVETAGDVLNEMKRFSGKLSDRVLPLRVDGGAGIASGGADPRGGAHAPREIATPLSDGLGLSGLFCGASAGDGLFLGRGLGVRRGGSRGKSP